MSVTSLANYQMYFNGLTMGTNTPFYVQSVDGLKDLPPIRSQDSDRGYLDGSFSGQDFLSGRTLTINMIVLDGNGNSAQANANLLKSALMYQKSGVSLLQFQLSSDEGLKRVWGRVRNGSISIDVNYSNGYIVAQFKIFCPDPRIYDDTVQSATLLAQNPNGRTFNSVYPLSFGGGLTAGSGPINNGGNVETFPIITITGPCVNPIIGNSTTGLYISVNYTLNTGDVMVIDLYNRTVTLNGVPARNLFSGLSRWFSAAVGSNSFYFTASGASGTTSAVVSWANAYV